MAGQDGGEEQAAFVREVGGLFGAVGVLAIAAAFLAGPAGLLARRAQRTAAITA